MGSRRLLLFAALAAPVAAITSPAAASVFAVANTVTVAGTCSFGCYRVDLFYNGALIGSCVPLAGSWSFKWSPGLLRAAGSKNMVAVAHRGAKTGSSAPRAFVVDNVPLRAQLGAGGDFWSADDLAFANGATVTAWVGRCNGLTWTSSTATMLTAGWTSPAGALKCVSIRVAATGEMNCNALAPLFQGTDPPVTVVPVMQVPAGLGTGTQMVFTATSTASSTPKWLLEHVGTAAAMKLAKQTTTLTFSSAANLRVDFGQHMYVATDTGTVMGVWRDSGARQNADTTQALNVADAAINTVNLGVQNNAGSKVNRADQNMRALWVGPTASLTQQQLQYLTNFCFGNFDQDQYYGDSTTAHEVDIFAGQSNTQGLAVSTLPAVPAQRFFFYSDNNWLSDPATLQNLAPQGAAPNIGYWYQSAIARQAAVGATPVHAIGVGSGSKFCADFLVFGDGGYYDTGLFDEFCRNLETSKCLLGGTPTYRLIWGQGESDATDATASGNYLTNVTAVFAAYTTRVGDPNLPIVVIGLNGNSPGQAFAATVQAAEASIAASRSHTALVTTSDIPFGVTYFVSVFHYNELGQVTVGNRVGAVVVP